MTVDVKKDAVERLLESHEVTLQCAQESTLEQVDLTDRNKYWLAERVLQVLERQGLELDYNLPRIRLVIIKKVPSQLSYEGLPCVDLDGYVFIFTTVGPKRFVYRFSVLAENVSMI